MLCRNKILNLKTPNTYGKKFLTSWASKMNLLISDEVTDIATSNVSIFARVVFNIYECSVVIILHNCMHVYT